MIEKLVQHLVTIGTVLLLGWSLGPVTRRLANAALESYFHHSLSLGKWNRALTRAGGER